MPESAAPPPLAISARSLKEALAAKRAALIIVSLGTNDPAVPMSVEQYRKD